jgi:hypothetical protein
MSLWWNILWQNGGNSLLNVVFVERFMCVCACVCMLLCVHGCYRRFGFSLSIVNSPMKTMERGSTKNWTWRSEGQEEETNVTGSVALQTSCNTELQGVAGSRNKIIVPNQTTRCLSHTSKHTHIYTRTHTSKHTHVNPYTCKHTHTYIHTYTSKHTHM